MLQNQDDPVVSVAEKLRRMLSDWRDDVRKDEPTR